MPGTTSITAALLVLAIRLTVAQFATQVQPNVTICNWAGLRTGIIRDTIYLDGGSLWWQSATDNNGVPVTDNNGGVEGIMFSLNLSYAFDTMTFNQTTSLLQPMSKTGGTAGNNIAPNYRDGALFANNGEFYLYGGLLRLADSYTPPAADAVLGYEAYQYGPERGTWSRGFISSTLPDNVTRYVSNGAAVSAPSENLGFYFSGIRGAGWGPITEATRDWYPAESLIQVDMTTMRDEVWSNITLLDEIPPRAGAELVWIPVGGQGVLVAIGGMTAVEYRLPGGLNSTQLSHAEQWAPGFMTSLPVYDIVTQTWYMQNTTGDGPGQLTEFCSVVASARDSSSFNIYIYGGYDGLNSSSIPSDDVWILSIPSFTWIKAYSGVPAHGRRGHQCERIYPDQMLVIGGVSLDSAHCLVGGPIQVFNLNTLDFQNLYDPREWSEYDVPDVVTAVIGGTGQGGSTRTATFSDNALSNLFETPYTKTINRYYPYSPASGFPGATPIPTAVPTSGGLAKWVAPVLGVVLGLIFLSIIVVLILLYRRRARKRNSVSGSTVGSSYNNRILNWVNGMPSQPSDRKTDDSVSSTDVDNDASVSSPMIGFSEVAGQERFEVEGKEKEREVAEMPTPYNFQNHDFAYGRGTSASDSQSRPKQNNANGTQTHNHGLGLSPSTAISPQSPRSSGHLHSHSGGSTNSVVGGGARAPSPFVLPQRRDDTGSRSATASPSPSSAARSPDLNLGSGNDRTTDAANPTTTSSADGIQRRPTHHRNVSSLSNNLYQLPSPDAIVSPDEDEDRRRSHFLSGLSNSPPLQGGVTPRFGPSDPERERGAGGPGDGDAERHDLVIPDVGEEEEEEGEQRRSGGEGSTKVGAAATAGGGGEGTIQRTKTTGKQSNFGEMLG